MDTEQTAPPPDFRMGVTTSLDTSAAISSAFARLRQQGIMAKRHYLCCPTCAFADAHEKMRDHVGVAFIHEQGEDALKQYDRAYIHFARNTKLDAGVAALTGGEPPEEGDVIVAEVIVNALVAAGLTVEWNGTRERSICVLGARALAAEAREAGSLH